MRFCNLEHKILKFDLKRIPEKKHIFQIMKKRCEGGTSGRRLENRNVGANFGVFSS